MKLKLSEVLLLAASLGFLILWIAEYQRTSFADSYWLLMLSLGLLMTFQFLKNRRLERAKPQPPIQPPPDANRSKPAIRRGRKR